MSRVLSLRLKDEQMERLTRLARRADRTPSALAARLIEEALRMAEFPHIEFRATAAGRDAYIKGSKVGVWFVLSVARGFGHDAARVAEHFGWPEERVQSAFAYAKAFPEEIDAALAEHDAMDEAALRRRPPQLRTSRPKPGEGGDAADGKVREDAGS